MRGRPRQGPWGFRFSFGGERSKKEPFLLGTPVCWGGIGNIQLEKSWKHILYLLKNHGSMGVEWGLED